MVKKYNVIKFEGAVNMSMQKNEDKYIYEFISPIIVEETFMIDEQDFYIDNISEKLFNKLQLIIKDFMNKLGDKGIASFLEKNLKQIINKIIIYPQIINDKLYCKTLVVSSQKLSPVSMGILLDFLEDEFMNGFGNKLSNMEFLWEIEDEIYFNRIYKYLQINNLQYTIRFNFYDYNKFFLEKI